MKSIKEQLEDLRDLITDEETALFHIDSGFAEGVELHISNLKIYLWDDQNETRDWDEKTNDYTPFKDLVLNEIDKNIKKLNQLKKEIKTK